MLDGVQVSSAVVMHDDSRQGEHCGSSLRENVDGTGDLDGDRGFHNPESTTSNACSRTFIPSYRDDGTNVLGGVQIGIEIPGTIANTDSRQGEYKIRPYDFARVSREHRLRRILKNNVWDGVL